MDMDDDGVLEWSMWTIEMGLPLKMAFEVHERDKYGDAGGLVCKEATVRKGREHRVDSQLPAAAV